MGDPARPPAGGAPLRPQPASDPAQADHSTDPPPRRAGRNLPAAFAVGGGLAAVVLASLLLWPPSFLAVIVVAVGVGSWELIRAVGSSGARPPVPPVLAAAVALPVAAWFAGPAGLSVAVLLVALTVVGWRLAGGPAGYLRDVGAATLIMVYVPFLGGFAALLGAADDGQWRLLVMLAVVVLSDTGGYVAGVLFGRHPMAPAISPKKSWEGLAGSLVAAGAGGAVGLALGFGVSWWWGALVGLAVAVAAVLGDLAESLLKRDLGVKDMSGLLPGHGGLMDRLDSLLFAAPAAYLLLSVVAG